MEVETVACNNCGAPLEVGPGTNYVTCAHCGSRLVVKRTPTSVYTELLEKLDQKTDVMTRQLAQIAYQNELERIDREWEQERQGYLSTDKYGNKQEPTTVAALFGGVVMIGFGLFFAVTSSGHHHQENHPNFGMPDNNTFSGSLSDPAGLDPKTGNTPAATPPVRELTRFALASAPAGRRPRSAATAALPTSTAAGTCRKTASRPRAAAAAPRGTARGSARSRALSSVSGSP